MNNVKTKRTSIGGSSQARYQRHVENFHLHHMKEVVEVLDRVVRDEVINQIVVACDEVAKPLLMEQLPKHLAEKIVDVLKLDINTPEQRVLAETMDALREKDAETDASQVEAMLGAWRGNGLGVAGPEETLKALEMGQVEELLIASQNLEQMDEKAVTQVERVRDEGAAERRAHPVHRGSRPARGRWRCRRPIEVQDMSRQNKVNKGNYDQAGRLTPDDMAREREKMSGSPDRVRNQEPRPRKRGERESSPGRNAREE